MSSLLNHSNDEDLHTDALLSKPRDDIRNKTSPETSYDIGTETRENGDKATSETSTLPPSANSSSTSQDENLRSNPRVSSSNKKKKPAGTGDSKTKPRAQGGIGVQHIAYKITHATGVHIGNTNIMQFGANVSPTQTIVTPKETKEIKKLRQSVEPITLDDIELASTHIGANWMQVGRSLKYSSGQLEQFYEDHGRKCLKEAVYQMLLDWMHMNTKEATIGKLANALWTAKQYDVIDQFTKQPTKKTHATTDN